MPDQTQGVGQDYPQTDQTISQPSEDYGNNEGNYEGQNEEEEADPKKEIQKETGELSQNLRLYNQDQENPDTELNKYVAGMILKQVGKTLTDKDKRNVVKKMDGGSEDEGNQEDDMQESKMPKGNGIFEIFGDFLNDRNKEDRQERKITNKKVKKNSPFVSNI